MGGISRRIAVHTTSGEKNAKPYLKKTKAKRLGWEM
jgi:hypothetical protein